MVLFVVVVAAEVVAAVYVDVLSRACIAFRQDVLTFYVGDLIV